MHVILTTDVPSLGYAGEVVEVKAGYGSNYLIPQGMALLATPNNRSQIAHQRRAIEAKVVRERAEAEKLAKDIAGLEGRLKNPGFADKAPPKVVDETRAQLAEKVEQKATLDASIADLEASK